MPSGTIDYDYYATGCGAGCAAGRVSSITGPDAITLSYTYDSMLTTSVGWSGDVNGAVNWTHDNDLRVVTETVTADTTSTVQLGYDGDGAERVNGDPGACP